MGSVDNGVQAPLYEMTVDNLIIGTGPAGASLAAFMASYGG